MPFFSPKTWKQRIVEFPGRRRLDDTSSADVYDVSRAEGTVTQEGDGFTAANMNDLEQRINNAVNDVAGLSADEYDPNATYSSGDLRIHDNILHKANQDISVAEAWTPEHWELTTLAAELSSLNSRIHKIDQRISVSAQTSYFYTGLSVTIPANSYFVLTARCVWGSSRPVWVGIASDSGIDTSQYAEGIGELATVSCTYSGFVDEETTFYIWGKWSATGNNEVVAKGFYIAGS